MNRRTILILGAVIAAGIAWYAFRPERLFINQTVNEQFPAATATQAASATAAPRAIRTGRFHGVAHDGKGMATIFQLAAGNRILRFTDFATSNGPDLQVYLVADDDAKDSDTVKQAGFVSLGPIKGNQGDQNYDVPADTDLNKYRSVTVWCRRFGVNFATAPLTQPGM